MLVCKVFVRASPEAGQYALPVWTTVLLFQSLQRDVHRFIVQMCTAVLSEASIR